MPVGLVDIDNNNGLWNKIELPYNDNIIIHHNTKIVSPRSSPYSSEQPVEMQYNKTKDLKLPLICQR